MKETLVYNIKPFQGDISASKYFIVVLSANMGNCVGIKSLGTKGL
jgi:hypothetical protein